MSLARGLDYYTGMIFEAVLVKDDSTDASSEKIGSIAGGGRYDGLIGMFSKHKIPSTGGSLGIERVFTILEKQHAQTTFRPSDVVIGVAGTIDKAHILKLAAWLWDANIKTSITYTDKSVGE